MVATYRLIKDDGHAAHENCVGDVYLEMPSLVIRSLDIGRWSSARIVRSVFTLGFELSSSGTLYSSGLEGS
jgi:hypothetical protein